MNKHIISILTFTIVLAVVTSCQPDQKDGQIIKSESKDTIMIKNIPPAESGYADVNGLKMYYEVYGNGEPLVLLHGSFMTIPLNWSHIIPLVAKDRKVIVMEMQGHGRTRDVPRALSYQGFSSQLLYKHITILHFKGRAGMHLKTDQAFRGEVF